MDNKFEYRIKNVVGLHARPARSIVDFVKDSGCNVYFTFAEKRVNAKSLLGLVSLGAVSGDTITIEIEKQDMKLKEQFIELLSEIL